MEVQCSPRLYLTRKVRNAKCDAVPTRGFGVCSTRLDQRLALGIFEIVIDSILHVIVGDKLPTEAIVKRVDTTPRLRF